MNLSCNRIQDKGASAFAEVLGEDVPVVELRLDHCSITDAGLNALAKSLNKNARLRQLRLWGNLFESRSACRFMDVLENEGCCLELDIKPYAVDGKWAVAKAKVATK